jgi:hypothetical protein
MPKDQFVKDGKVYEVDTEKKSVEEVGTVKPKDEGLFNAILDIPGKAVEKTLDTVYEGIDKLTGKK